MLMLLTVTLVTVQVISGPTYRIEMESASKIYIYRVNPCPSPPALPCHCQCISFQRSTGAGKAGDVAHQQQVVESGTDT